MKMKTIMSYFSIFIRIAIMTKKKKKSLKITSADEDVEKKAPLYTSVVMLVTMDIMGKVWKFPLK